jgi:PleD family two-component response regulator
LVENNVGTVQLMRLALREVGPDFDLVCANGLPTALAHLAENRFDIILLDPALNGTGDGETVRLLREAAPDVPLLLLAAAADVGLCLRAMEQGAHDYLFKDVLTTHLLSRMIRDAVDRSRPAVPAGAHLFDPVTGLANREGLLSQATHLWHSPTRLRKGATLLYLTLDGLAAGERALIETADILRDTFRGSDLRARIGDADFVLLAVGAPEATTPILIARLEESLNGFNAQPDRDYYLVLRGGTAHYASERPCTFEEMFDAARRNVGSIRLGRRPMFEAGQEAAAS